MTRRSPMGLDTQAFSDFLNHGVDPIVRAISKTAPDRLSMSVDEMFTMALTLVSTKHAGPAAQQDYVNKLWRDIAPSFSTLIAHDPIESLSMLTNAMIKVAGDPNIRSEDWLNHIAQIAPDAQDISTLKSLCIIASWRSGGVNMRGAALKAANKIPEALACKAVRASKKAKWEKVYDRLIKDIWWRPDEQEVSGHMVGDFAGFRGTFLHPPILKPALEGFLVRSADLYFHLTVDAFGTKLHPINIDAFKKAKTGKPPQKENNPIWAKIFPSDELTLISNANSVAATSPHSYSIHVSPLQGKR